MQRFNPFMDPTRETEKKPEAISDPALAQMACAVNFSAGIIKKALKLHRQEASIC